MMLFQEPQTISSNAQFWAVVVLFATLIAYIIKSEYNRWRDKKNDVTEAKKRKAEREIEKQERLDAEKRARLDREEIAARIKAEQRETEDKVRRELERNAEIIRQQLQLHYDREMLELQKSAFGVIEKLGAAEQVVKTLDSKIVTLVKAEEHTDKIVNEVIKGAEKAEAAFEVANTINEKLSKMSDAGLLNQEQEAGRVGIDKIEAEKTAGQDEEGK